MLAVSMLLEGNSIRSTMRITGLDQNTIMKVLVLAGEKCDKLMGRLIVNIRVRDVQADEISPKFAVSVKSVALIFEPLDTSGL